MSADARLPSLSREVIQQLDELCDQFESALQTGQNGLLEDLLVQVEEAARPRLFRDLLELEVHYRVKAGRPLTGEEAARRFADLGLWAGDVLAGLGLDADSPALLLQMLKGPVAGQTFSLVGHARFLVGRSPGNNLALTGDEELSRTHFCIEFHPPLVQLTDSSKNGTYHNDHRLSRGSSVALRDGDMIGAGDLLIRARIVGGNPTITAIPSTRAPAGDEPSSGAFADAPVIPGYAIEAELGRGGMGVVYRARRRLDGAAVAIKTVLPALAPRPETSARFRREVGILEELDHSNIVRFHETGMASGALFFVMELVNGTSASQRVKESGPFPVPRVVELGSQLLDALAHAHDRGFVHRDVKPGNLLLTGPQGQETLKLADFGLARAYQASAMSGLTVSGQSGGTPGFMPPEQVRDFRAAQPHADQYSAAATLYYLTTGQHIYELSSSLLDLLARVLQDEPIPLRPGPPHPALAGSFGVVVRRALARQPQQRYPNVRAMRAALQGAS